MWFKYKEASVLDVVLDLPLDLLVVIIPCFHFEVNEQAKVAVERNEFIFLTLVSG